jgi:hypothetical protein
VSVLEEAWRLPAASVDRARGIAWIKPPDHLAHLVPRVRSEHGGVLNQVHRAIDEQLAGEHPGGIIGAFYAASELALIAEVWRSDLSPADRNGLRACWADLLAA